MMRVITANVNGIRSAAKKGFFSWLAEQAADLVCLQEVRAATEQLNNPLFTPEGFYCMHVTAQKAGYSGVTIYSRAKPKHIISSLDFALSDNEGRYLEFQFDHLTVASIYFPSGTSGEHRQEQKYHFMAQFEAVLQRLSTANTILCGDWNIAHKEIDLKNWKANQNSSGFLPQERAWLDQVFGTFGWVDAFRVKDQRPDQYTWWSARHRGAWENNAGWRIDYQVVTPSLKNSIQAVSIYRGKQFSDHAPLIIDYDWSI